MSWLTSCRQRGSFWLLTAVCCSVFSTHVINAATRVWSAPPFGGDRRWSVPANWSGVAPLNGDSIVFTEDSDFTFQDESTNNISNLQLVAVTLSGLNNAVPDVFGNIITLSGGITESVSFWGASFFVPLTLSASQTFESSIDGHLELTNVNLGTHTLTLNARTNLSRIEIRGRISGSGNIVATGRGTVTFRSPLTNTYTGLTRVLSLADLSLRASDGANGIPSVPGDLIVGDGTNAASVSIYEDNQIGGDVTLNRNSDMLISSAVAIVPSLTMNDAEVLTIGSGLLSVAGPVIAGGTMNSRIKGNVTLGSSSSRTFDVTNNVILTMEAFIDGTGLSFTRPGIIKTGAGTLLLLSNNTFNGSVSINDGRLIAAAPRSLGTPSGTFTVLPVGRTFVNEGGELLLAAVRITNEVLSLTTTQGGLSSTGTCVWLGNVFVNTNVPVNVSNSSLTVDGDVGGDGGLIKNGTGTLTLTGTNDNAFTGLSRHQSGVMLLDKPAGVIAMSGPLVVGNSAGGANVDIVRVQADEQIADSVHVTMTSSGQLDINAPETIGSISGSGNVRLDGGDLTVGGNGVSTNCSSTFAGAFGLTKIGSGTLTLSGSSTNTGLTRVLAGTLVVNGSQPQSPVSVVGANLEGGGVVGHVTSNGRIAPGGSGFDTLTTSNLTFTAGGSLEIQISGNAPGTNQDQMIVRGSIALANAALNLSLAGFLPASGDSFTILNNDGADAIGSTFSGLANGSFVSAGPGKRFRIQYNGGDGNDITLTFTNETVRVLAVAINAGNGNNRLDPNECNLLGGSVTNMTAQNLSNVTVEFFPRSAGVTISHPIVVFSNLAPNALAAIPSSVVLSVASNVTCGSAVQLEMELRADGIFVSSTPISLTVGSGGPSGCVDGGVICSYCPDVVINGTLLPGDTLQSLRLNETTPTDCGGEGACPGTTGSGTRLVDAMLFQNGPRSACITVTLSNRCAGGVSDLFAAAYLGSFNPSNVCANYYADAGDAFAGGKEATFSFRVGANASFVVTVNELNAGSTCTDYTLTVTGGDCRPRLQITNIPGPNVRLSWPNSAVEWVPQLSLNLSNWFDIFTTRTNIGGRVHLNSFGGDPARFFRLREP